MKKTLWVGIVLLVILVIGFIVAVVSLDGIVKNGVETFGPEITKVPVTVDTIHIGLLTGSAKVRDLIVGNPPGCKLPDAIRVGLVEVGVNPFSILSDKIVVRSISVDAPEITFEGGLHGNNLSKILANVNDFTKTGATPATGAPAGTKPAKKMEVDDFLITNAKVHVSITDLGGKEMNLTLPDIHLTDLGKGSDGLTPADLTRAVLSAITSATIKAVAAGAGDLGKGMENLGKGAAQDAAGGVDKIKKSLGGIFGK